jgi:hypothetical protein
MPSGQQIKKGDILVKNGVLYRVTGPGNGGDFVPVETMKPGGPIKKGGIEVSGNIKILGQEDNEAKTFNAMLDEGYAAGLPFKWGTAGKRRRTRHRKSRKNKRTRRH